MTLPPDCNKQYSLELFFFWTAIVGLGLLYEVRLSHSVSQTTLGRTPLDE